MRHGMIGRFWPGMTLPQLAHLSSTIRLFFGVTPKEPVNLRVPLTRISTAPSNSGPNKKTSPGERVKRLPRLTLTRENSHSKVVFESRASFRLIASSRAGFSIRWLVHRVFSARLFGDFCGSGTVPRNLLPGGELGAAGQDDGAR